MKRHIASSSIADFNSASTFLTTACTSAAGWSAAVHDPHAAAAPSVLQYAWDSVSGWLWVCSLPVGVFSRESVAASRCSPAQVATLRSALGSAIYQAATKGGTGTSAGASWERELASLLASYAGTTQTWQLADRLRDGGHFIVLYYRDPSQSSGMLRPFSLPVSAKGRDVLPVGEVRELIRSVSAMDRVRHPEWFSSR